MARKKLPSGLELYGVGPNILLSHVENTAPFLFKGEINTQGPKRAYLQKLVFYKKNLKALNHINLAEYFYICMSAHWATAGTFVPTNVDNQIREGLWRHEKVGGFLDLFAKITIDSWTWDYSEVTNRICTGSDDQHAIVMSTHEGTWLSVAIGGYCALKKNKREDLASQVQEVILMEIEKEQKILLEYQEKRDAKNFLRASALMAHNFGDLDRVMDQWQMDPEDIFYQRIYKLGHKLNDNYSPVFAFAGAANKEFLAQENHRHMSLRAPKCLRQSKKFLVPVGPFMDDWGRVLGESALSLENKAEIVMAFMEGHKRQDLALGYTRALHGLLQGMKEDIDIFESVFPFDLFMELKKSKLFELSKIPQSEFEINFLERFQKYSAFDYKF